MIEPNKPAIKSSVNIQGNLLDLQEPIVMGIVNCTPDSFYDGGKTNTLNSVIQLVENHLNEGAKIIDLGAYSSRPGAKHISIDEEWKRLQKVIHVLVKEFPNAIISVDTFRSTIAQQAIADGAHIINDISGGTLDVNMFETVANLKVPYILMHMRGTPQTMQTLTEYNNVAIDVTNELALKIDQLRQLGVCDIWVDPGFGFAKTLDQNFELLVNLKQLQLLDLPIMAGVSRKSMIYKTLNTTPQEALNGTTALNMLALQNGAKILRVHDVKPAVECVQLYLKAEPYL